jgi:hypothetical protein
MLHGLADTGRPGNTPSAGGTRSVIILQRQHAKQLELIRGTAATFGQTEIDKGMG